MIHFVLKDAFKFSLPLTINTLLRMLQPSVPGTESPEHPLVHPQRKRWRALAFPNDLFTVLIKHTDNDVSTKDNYVLGFIDILNKLLCGIGSVRFFFPPPINLLELHKEGEKTLLFGGKN